jgi:hypothetical protein
MPRVDWAGDAGLTAGAMTRSIKPWLKWANVPHTFHMSSVGMSETECLSSVTVNVVLVHSSPNDVRITLTREGKQSVLPRANSISTTVLLKDFGSTSTLLSLSLLSLFSLSSLSLSFASDGQYGGYP